MKRHLKRALELPFVLLAAAVVFVEETLLRYLGLAMAALAKWPPLARLEGRLRRLPPWGALLVFAAPSVLVIPIKLAAVWFAINDRYALAILSLAIGKMLATALVARLYQVLRPTLLQIPSYRRIETWLFAWRDRLYTFVRTLPAWRRAVAVVQQTRAWLRDLVFRASSR
ncbi:MAG: major facilitator superfamily domain-containing protein 7 [Alphaproteobacteria bacterium]|nr:major facilitator superfamily domain-containing protein 7 [Alphaproteobacteria bacterium]